MQSIYHEAQCIAASGKKILVNFSRGRDSLVQAHLLLRLVPRDRLVFLHYWVYPDLEYQLKHLAICERFFGVQIHREESNDASILRTGKVEESRESERDRMLDKYGCELSAMGFRMDETLWCRNRLRRFTDGINASERECYPIKSWTAPVVRAYVEKCKLPLAEEYGWGLNDLGSRISDEGVVWLLEHHPEDFVRASARDPLLLSEYTKATGKIL